MANQYIAGKTIFYLPIYYETKGNKQKVHGILD